MVGTPTAMPLHARVRAGAEQVSSELAGEVVILDLKHGVYHGLDGAGARIWQLLQEPRRVTDVRDALLEEYEVERHRCESDLLRLLQELSERGLIDVACEGESRDAHEAAD